MGCFDDGGGSSTPPAPDPAVDKSLNTLSDISQKQYDFYQGTYQPLQTANVAQAARFSSPEYASSQAAQAEGDVTKQFSNQRNALAMDPLTANPNRAGYMAGARGLDIAQAGGTAAAATTARNTAALTGFNTNAALAGQGQAMVQGATQAAGAAGQVGNQATSNALYGWNAQNQQQSQSAAGLGSLLGTVGGLGLMAFSSKKLKTNIKPVKGGLDAVDKMPVKKWQYKPETGLDQDEHIGPMAEDFQDATGTGDGKMIHLGDAVGQTMGAVQQLHGKVKRLEARAGL